ncbi:MAG: glycosyltransferase [Acidobacteriota bacterium]|nr:glycosyltransferase [Acidobacteriota bacterium]
MSGGRTRVLFLSHAYMVGGAEEMVLNLVRHLPERFEPAVVCIHEAGPIGEEIARTGVPFKVLGLTPGLLRPFDVLRLRDFLIECEPTIVHTFLLTGSLYGRFAAMMAHVPVIIGTEVNIYQHKKSTHARLEKWLMRRTDTVVASAASVREFYIDQVKADPSKVEVIYNAVDWTQLQTTMSREEFLASVGVPQDVPVAGIIARLTPQKAHQVLFDAIAHDPGLAKLHLLVVGDGELRSSLTASAQTLRIEERVHFLGARRDLGNILASIDLFAMPSYWEGLPLSMVLAMGAGLPVVASRVAGIPEVVKDGVSGLLVTPGDTAELAAALNRVVHDDTLRVLLGQEARAFVRPRFGVDGYVASVTAMYDRLLAEKGLAPALSGVER